MAKRDRLQLAGGTSIETGPDWNGRYYIAHRKGCSMFFRDASKLRLWLKLPKGTPSREAFDCWLNALGDMDQGSKQKANAGQQDHPEAK